MITAVVYVILYSVFAQQITDRNRNFPRTASTALGINLNYLRTTHPVISLLVF